MTTPIPARDFPRWDANHAATLDAARLLLYRSNLLGSDLRITNYGGGKTSAKIWQADPLTGQQVQVLWVKGSGGDLGSMALDCFSTLYMDKLLALQAIYRGPGHEDEMVGYLPHCTFNLNPRVASIDTPLHAYLPFAHVDHMHPDAVIAIAAMADSEKLTQQIFAGTVGWLPWRRPGFELGLMLQRYQAAHPGQRGLVLAGHGLFSWGDDARACYDNTVGLIASAPDWLDPGRGGGWGGRGWGAGAPFRRPGAPGAEPGRAGRHAGAGAAGAARPGQQDRTQAAACRAPGGGAGVRQQPRPGAAGGLGHLLPGPFPAHQDSPADPGAGGLHAARRGAGAGAARTAGGRETVGGCVMRTGSWCCCAASAWWPWPKTRPRRALPPSFMSTPST